jgi:nucleotide-binding universal stress UspA family protein
MSYKSIFAHALLGHDNANVFAVSGQLAAIFGADITGISGAQLTRPYSEMPVVIDSMRYEREAAEKALNRAEEDFRTAFRAGNFNLSWRSCCDFWPVADFLAQEARAADLIVTSPEAGNFLERLDETRLGPLVLKVGRPVLIVPREHRHLKLEKVVVAWKDSREARRAVVDALPLLRKAETVSVVEICSPALVKEAHQRTADVAQWLKLHGVTAHGIADPSPSGDIEGLRARLRNKGCDLLVAGAYGHTRLREWTFGGVTMDLLLPGSHCTLVSH